MTVDLLGANLDRRLVDIETTEDGLTAISKDPQLLVRFAEPVGPGWYTIDAEIEALPPVEPRLYVELEGMFSQGISVPLHRRRKNRFSGTFQLPVAAHAVRFDPTETPGPISLDRVVLRRLGSLGTYGAIGKHGVSLIKRDPKGFSRRIPLYLSILRTPQFLPLMRKAGGNEGSDFQRWISAYDFNEKRDGAGIKAKITALQTRPLISVVMPVYNTPARLLDATIASVAGQLYPHWELCIADDKSRRRDTRRVLERWRRRDRRIKVVYRKENGHISEATNSAFELAEGKWVALLDHDDILRPHALAEVAFEIDRHPDAQLIYSDEDKLGFRGRRYDPYFKPDYSRELFRSHNYLNHLTVHRAANIRAAGGWRKGYEGSQDYDLNLRIVERLDAATIRHIPKILYHWRAATGSTAMSGALKSYAYDAGFRALQDHAQRTGLPAAVEQATGTPFYRIRHAVPDPAPLVSLIIPTRDKVEILRPCVESILSETTYSNYEILIVDNGSQEPETLAYLEQLTSRGAARVLAYNHPFNYSAINNFAVAHASGSLVALVNNDIEVISAGWLDEMVSWAVQPDVGCVGAKLYYGDNTIQHAGVLLGVGGVANHAHLGLSSDAPGYFGRAVVISNCSAVTAACLVVRKAIYEQVDGLDQDNLSVAFNDVDFCLRVRESGYVNVFTPYATLYHHESKSRGADNTPDKIARFAAEVGYMQARWQKQLSSDPYYSVNLTRSATNFELRD